ncbi:amino acid ABC transporter substrate-binding protein [Pseudomonas boanensis]|uniref:amino acid ABC transporter substrate-binding protein n=1 Tax=Metapseudomonas boanensis TaxID=2822138 RepID=UPI0035D4A892
MEGGLRFWIGAWLCLCASLVSATEHATETVQVAGAQFPPYVVKPDSADASGLLLDLLAALNAIQSNYYFIMRPTAIPRRFRDFQEGRIDLAVFENPDWGWQGIPGVRIDMGLEDTEVFVAASRSGRDQRYFDDLSGKRLALFSGYHYGFASFNADPQFLKQEFNAKLSYSHDSNLRMLLRERADIALVTRSYFGAYLEVHPEEAGRFLVSDRVDQRYRHYALLRPQAPISGPAFHALLEQLRTNGQLEQIFAPYGVTVRPAAAGSSATADGSD